MRTTRLAGVILAAAMSLADVRFAMAHVTVNPRKAEPETRHQMFYLRAPVEKEIPVVELGLEVDEAWRKNGGDLNSFELTAGWNLHVEKDDAGKVKRVFWDGGQAPAETFQLVNISMNTPKQPGKYPFKAWQKYSDGSVVWWNERPAEGQGQNEGGSVENPYSVVEIVAKSDQESRSRTPGGAGALQYGALALALAALLVSFVSRNGRGRSGA